MRIRSLGDSQVTAGVTAAAPASGATVATVNVANGDGVYDITVDSSEAGTPDANGANMNLKHGATVVGALLSVGSSRRTVVQRALKQNDAISVVVGASVGGAGSVYAASIILDRLS